MVPQKHTEFSARSETLTIPELEQSKAAVLNTLASVHSRRSYPLHSQISLGLFPELQEPAAIVALIQENETLRREAIHIEILYRIKPLRRTMVGLTYQ